MFDKIIEEILILNSDRVSEYNASIERLASILRSSKFDYNSVAKELSNRGIIIDRYPCLGRKDSNYQAVMNFISVFYILDGDIDEDWNMYWRPESGKWNDTVPERYLNKR